MADKIRWGILSTASIGRRRVIPAIGQSKNGVVTAVASRHLERARTFAQETGIPNAYGSYDELIADPNVDAIYNPLPNSEHALWSLRCAEAGKPVLCEKPLASDAAEAQMMVNAFKTRGVPLAEAFMYRFHPQTQRVYDLVREQAALGELKSLNAVFTFTVRREDDVRLSKPLAGGSVMDVGCYCINVMRLMTGEEPDDARAFTRMGASSGVDESLTGILSFPSGALGHFDCSLRTHRAYFYELRGTRGRILVEDGFVIDATRPSTIRLWRGEDYEEIRVEPANSYTLMAEDFADALLHSRPPRFDPQDGVANMRVIDRLLGRG